MLDGRGWVLGLGVIACASGCGFDREARGFGAPAPTLERSASDRTREDLGIDAWELQLVGKRSVTIHARDASGSSVADASVTLAEDAWRAAVSGKWNGEVEIDLHGAVLQHSLMDGRILEYCRDDMKDFRAGGVPGMGGDTTPCQDGANAAVVGCDNGAPDQCMMDLLGMYLECEAASGSNGENPGASSSGAEGGASASDTDNAGSDTDAGGSGGSEGGSAGSEGGSGGSGGSRGGSEGGSEGSGGGSEGSGGGSEGSGGGWGSSG